MAGLRYSTVITVVLMMTFLLLPAPILEAAIPQAERNALIALYNATNGPSWTNRSGWLGAPGTECTWQGVACDSGQTMVVQLNLWQNRLSGNLPPEIGNLTNLQELHMDSNRLGGSIPPELGNLTSLRVMVFWGNQLSGSVPRELSALTNLEELNLANNQLGGSIPPELGTLSKLRTLFLNDNELSGSIPPELAGLTSLESIDLDRNELSGGVPAELGALSNLWELGLSGNHLSGSLPAQLGQLTKLRRLFLNGNQLSGDLPADLASLTSMMAGSINLGYNALYATSPAADAWATTWDPDWKSTQTIAPAGVAVAATTSTAVTLTWTPIAFTTSVGRYEVWADGGAGSFLAGATANKSAAGLTVSGLATNNTYTLTVRTITDPASPYNSNTVTSDFSAGVQATTSSGSPTVTTNAATSITQSGATLHGTVNPNGAAATGWFEWGSTISYGNTTSPQSVGSGSVSVPFVHPISGLTSGSTYHFRAVGQNAAGTTNGLDETFTTTACQPVGLSSQPASQSASAGQAVTLSVTATGTSPEYQWYEGPSGNTTNPIAGAHDSTYETPVLSAGTYTYWVRVSNSCPSSVDSATATVTVTVCDPPGIASQPEDVVVGFGQQATLSVTESGTDPALQWYAGTVVGSSTPIPGATSRTYTTPRLTETSSYFVRVSVACIGEFIDSRTATVTVLDKPAIATFDATPLSIKAGETTSLRWTLAGVDSGTLQRCVPDGACATLMQQAPAAGQLEDQPPGTSVYMLTISTPDGFASAKVVVTVGSSTGSTTVTIGGGKGMPGSGDGPGEIARFNRPSALSADPTEDRTLVVDSENDTVRSISGTGLVTTTAGLAGFTGSVDGQGGNARFDFGESGGLPGGGIAVDRTGSAWIADSANHVLRRVDPDGTVTTIAGTPHTPGAQDGAGQQARFNFPTHLALDSQGNVLIADTENHLLRRMTQSGIVTTIAGQAGVAGSTDGPARGGALLNRPRGITVDADGIIYFTDLGTDSLRRVVNGEVQTLTGGRFASMTGGTPFDFGQWGGGLTTSRPPGSTTTGATNVYVATSENQVISKTRPPSTPVPPAGPAPTVPIAGMPGVPGSDDGGSGSKFNQPGALTTDRDGRLPIADTGNHAIRLTVPPSSESGCTLRVRNPVGGASWVLGSVVTIEWATTGTACSSTVTVELRRAGVRIAVIDAAAVASSGSTRWTVPLSLQTGGGYCVCVLDNADVTFFDESDAELTLVDVPPPPARSRAVRRGP